MFENSFIRKYFFIAVIMCGVGQSSMLLFSEDNHCFIVPPSKAKKILGIVADVVPLYNISNQDQGSLSMAWQTLSHPVIAPLVFMVMKPVVCAIESQVQCLYFNYLLTPEQREEINKKSIDEQRAREIFFKYQATELELRKDKNWLQQEIQKRLDEAKLRKHKLRENEIILAQEERKERELQIEHSKKLLNYLSPEKRKEAQERLDNWIEKSIKSRMP